MTTPDAPLEIPPNWDRLEEAPDVASPAVEVLRGTGPATPLSILALAAASWGDLACWLGLCVAAAAAALVSGGTPGPEGMVWLLALALLWWSAAGAVLVVVRRATPGMLLAGVVLDRPVVSRRLLGTLAAAALSAATLGAPALLGPRRWLVAACARGRVVPCDPGD